MAISRATMSPTINSQSANKTNSSIFAALLFRQKWVESHWPPIPQVKNGLLRWYRAIPRMMTLKKGNFLRRTLKVRKSWASQAEARSKRRSDWCVFLMLYSLSVGINYHPIVFLIDIIEGIWLSNTARTIFHWSRLQSQKGTSKWERSSKIDWTPDLTPSPILQIWLPFSSRSSIGGGSASTGSKNKKAVSIWLWDSFRGRLLAPSFSREWECAAHLGSKRSRLS